MRLHTAAIIFCLLLPIICWSQISAFPKDSIPLDPAVRYGVLENGLTYYILKNTTPTNKIEMELVEKAGYYHYDSPGEMELAHFIEHLGFRSTVHFPKGLKKNFLEMGLRTGSDFSANTSEITNYHLSILSRDTLLLTSALFALYDWAMPKGRLYFPADVEEERSAVINEHNMGNSPGFLALMEAIYLQLDKNALYDPQLRFKSAENAKNVSIESLIRFDTQWYRPDLQAVIIVGDMDVDDMEQRVRRLFSTLKSESENRRPLPDIYKKYDVSLTGKDQLLVVGQGKENRQISIVISKKQKSQMNIGGPATYNQLKLQLMDGLYNEMAKNRLGKVSPEYAPMLRSVGHVLNRRTINSLAGIDGLRTFITVDSLADVKEAMGLVMTELRKIELWGFNPEEFISAKEIMRSSMGRANSLSLKLELANHFINRSAVIANRHALRDSLLDNISLSDINHMVKTWMGTEGNTDFLFYVPEDRDPALPTLEQVVSWVEEVKKRKLGKYKPNQIATLPNLPAKKTTRRYTMSNITQVDAVTMQLVNGINVVFKPVASNAENQRLSISLNGFRPGGTTTDGIDEGILQAFSKLAPYIGAATLNWGDLNEWKKEKSRLGTLGFIPYLNKAGAGVKGESSPNNYEALLQLVYWSAIKPKLDKEAILTIIASKNMEMTGVKSSSERWRDSIQSAIYENTVQTKLDVALLERAFRIYRENISGAAGYTFVITGSFNIEDVKDLTAKYLGALPKLTFHNQKPLEASTKALIAVNKQKRSENIDCTMIGDSTGNVQVRMLFPIYGPFTKTDQFALKAINLLLKRVLFTRLREKEQGVYGVFTNLVPGRDSGMYFLDIDFETAPVNIERLIAATKEEISTLTEKGPVETDFGNVLISLRNELLADLETGYYWSAYLVEQLGKGSVTAEIYNQEKLLNGLTIDDIRRASARFLDMNHYSLFKLL